MGAQAFPGGREGKHWSQESLSPYHRLMGEHGEPYANLSDPNDIIILSRDGPRHKPGVAVLRSRTGIGKGPASQHYNIKNIYGADKAMKAKVY